MAQAVDKEVPNTPGKKALAMEAFARALRQLPRIVADNGGYDSSELVTQLRAKHAAGANATWGVDGEKGALADMTELGVWEPVAVKQQTIKTAIESAAMLLRIDEIVSGTHKPEKKQAAPQQAAAEDEGGA